MPGRSGETEWRHLAEVSLVRAELPPPPFMAAIPSAASSSQILRGYSNALYSLGRRYEVALRNRREAFRCYAKAARLGHFMAFARLASRWLEASEPPSDAPDVAGRTVTLPESAPHQ